MEKFLNLEGLKYFKDKIEANAPYIGENQNWYVNREDTGVSAKGIEGSVASISTTGSGNAITSITMDNSTKEVTATKGDSFLPLSGGTVSGDVTFNGNINGTGMANFATKDEIPTIPSKVSELTNDSNYQTAEQVNSTVTIEIAKVVANAPEDFDTLKEMSDWIAGHEDDASAMNSAISDNKTAITALQTDKADKSEIPTTVAQLTDSTDYAKKTDLPNNTNQLTNGAGFITKSNGVSIHTEVSSDILTNFRTELEFGNGNPPVSTLRTNAENVDGMCQYSPGIAFETGDTHGYLNVNFNTPKAYIGGGNNQGINWHDEIVLKSHTVDKSKCLVEYDTRNNDLTPLQYIQKGMGIYSEFKDSSYVGKTSGYFNITTIVPYYESSGGYPIQFANGNNISLRRYGISNTEWSSWESSDDKYMTPGSTWLPYNGISIDDLPNGAYSTNPSILPDIGFPSGLSEYGTLILNKTPAYNSIIFHDVFGRFAVYNTNQNKWTIFISTENLATNAGAGITKLYDYTGSATDGAMTQKSITNALANKVSTNGGTIANLTVSGTLDASSEIYVSEVESTGSIFIDGAEGNSVNIGTDNNNPVNIYSPTRSTSISSNDIVIKSDLASATVENANKVNNKTVGTNVPANAQFATFTLSADNKTLTITTL